MEGQQDVVAEVADELEVLCTCLGVAFPCSSRPAILISGRTEYYPVGKIGNVSVDRYRHVFIIQLGRSPRT